MSDDPCKDCGKCCQHMDRPPFALIFDGTFTRIHTGLVDGKPVTEWADYPTWEAIPAALKQEVEDDRQAERPPGSPCLWYDAETKRCKHYEHRPMVCRDFQPGEPACNAWRIELGLIPLPPVEETW